MAYTTQVTKGTVTQISPTEFDVTVDVIVHEDGVEILNQAFSKRYAEGDTMSAVQTVLQKKIKEAVDKVVAERAVYNKAAFGTLCSDLQSSLDAYLNS